MGLHPSRCLRAAARGLCLALASASVVAPAQAAVGAWQRLQMQSLRLSDTPASPADEQLRDGLRRMWADRLDADEKAWTAAPGPAGGSYPVRTQWTVLRHGDRHVVVSALAGASECSLAGSFSKEDLFTWCVLRVQVAGQAAQQIQPACWIESEPGEVPDPAAFFMRARIESDSVRVQVLQRGIPVPDCEKVVRLP